MSLIRPLGPMELAFYSRALSPFSCLMAGFDALQQLRLPDAWQAEAIRALATGDDVIVQAPTGAGKTFIFEQYFQQRRGPGQVIFTVPTRALANDKFAEWNRQGWRVGITTATWRTIRRRRWSSPRWRRSRSRKTRRFTSSTSTNGWPIRCGAIITRGPFCRCRNARNFCS